MNRTRFFYVGISALLFCCLFFINQAAAVSSPKKNGTKKNVQVAAKHHDTHKVAVKQKRHGARQVAVGRKHHATAIKVAQHKKRSTVKSVQNDDGLSAKSAIIIDAGTGKILFERSPDIPRQPASTIKVLTGMIALQSLNSGELVPVSFKAAQQPSSKVFLEQNKEYLANDLINAVLLASANDASVALAEKIAGSEQSFAQKMTSFAHQWGAQQTVCKTATGLTAEGQETTARDLATIFRHAMENPEFAERMKQVHVRTSEGKVLRSHNRALWQVKGSEGGKTGYTNAARQTYVGKFRRGNDEIIVAIMGSECMWVDIKRLVELGFTRKNAHQVAAVSQPAAQPM